MWRISVRRALGDDHDVGPGLHGPEVSQQRKR